jgi:signal peptidase I
MTRTAITAPKSKALSTTAESPPKKKESMRDFVEQVVVAFILAFLIRGFEAEAFVIPTGSMAPTLYGQHKEVTCPECGDVFAVNAADEVDAGRFVFDPRDPDGPRKPPLVAAATCPNCWYRVTKLNEFPSFKGDRILVMKFLYNLPKWLGGQMPARWDVVVFHFPEEPETNYIKRLIGLPGETVRIAFGNIWTKPNDSDEPFKIARKKCSNLCGTIIIVPKTLPIGRNGNDGPARTGRKPPRACSKVPHQIGLASAINTSFPMPSSGKPRLRAKRSREAQSPF